MYNSCNVQDASPRCLTTPYLARIKLTFDNNHNPEYKNVMDLVVKYGLNEHDDHEEVLHFSRFPFPIYTTATYCFVRRNLTSNQNDI